MATQGSGGATGIKLGLTWPESSAVMVLERDDNNSFTSPTEIAQLSTVVTTYTDDLSINGVTYYYRAKHTQTGNTTSAWSATVSDTPRDL